MVQNKKALFLTHPNSINFKAKVSGGVQLCSREFYNVLLATGFDLTQVNVNYTKNIIQRICIKMKFGLYSMFNVKNTQQLVFDEIEKNKVKYVFINMSSLLRYAKPIKLKYGEAVKIYLLSHGNDTGDFLHLTTKPLKKYNWLSKIRDIIRLGALLHIESLYRNKYLDGVMSVSNTEKEIENWFGAKKSIFIPRTINKETKSFSHTNYSRAGFIGRLDHPPNYQGITSVLRELTLLNTPNIDFRLIGAPAIWGEKIQKEFPFVTYLGELSDEEVEKEVSTWGLILNTVFWYSTGVTTKFAKYLEWEVPTITTPQGTRGYQWKDGNIDYVNSPKEMAIRINQMINNKELIENSKVELLKIKNSALTIEELAFSLKKEFLFN